MDEKIIEKHLKECVEPGQLHTIKMTLVGLDSYQLICLENAIHEMIEKKEGE